MFFKDKPSQKSETVIQPQLCIAKTSTDANGRQKVGVDVETHCKIVGLVAKKLVALYPKYLQDSLFPSGTEFIAAVHDIGKINPLFQKKILESAGDGDRIEQLGLTSYDPKLESMVGYHSSVSQVALYEAPKYIPEIAGRHHGANTFPSILPTDEIVGGELWQAARLQVIESLRNYFSTDWPIINNETQALAISGLTTVADWIGSGYPFESIECLEKACLEKLCEQAIESAGFVRRHIIYDLSFSTVFSSFKPRPMQQAMINITDRPGLYIVEALMGEGKTEAALYASYQLLSSGSANGIYFALPTRLTSEKIHERVANFLTQIQPIRDNQQPLLLHGNSHLIEYSLGEEGMVGRSWFSTKKRGVLAPFAVGTIDQALMAVLNVRHGFVRAFGLAGKVVILDEVHTYDAYTGAVMDQLIATLIQLGSTVILLSATLTHQRKKTMIEKCGYRQQVSTLSSYPLITQVTRESLHEISPESSQTEKKISVQFTDNKSYAIEKSKEKALLGELVLWIENTVDEAQQVFKHLAAWGVDQHIEVGLMHSRFPGIVRQKLDDHWVSSFGKDGIPTRKSKGKILVGTQVLEQSLDIDADYLITRIAPSDMLLQRCGRLWRHREADKVRPHEATQAVLIISSPLDDVLQNWKKALGKTALVYAPYVLMRSIEVWKDLTDISLPSDMRRIIEQTYAERDDDGVFLSCKFEMMKNKETLQRLALNSIAKAGVTLSDNSPTRYSEVPTCPVLLLRRAYDSDIKDIILFNGERITLSPISSSLCRQRKQTAALLEKYMLQVPTYMAPTPLNQSQLHWLKPYAYISDSEDDRIRVALVEESGTLRGLDFRPINAHYDLAYTPVLGYVAKRRIDGKQI